MKRSARPSLHSLPTLLALVLTACAPEKLDGGSVSLESKTPANEVDAGAIPATPLAGVVRGKSFEAKTVDLSFSGGTWRLQIENRQLACGFVPEPGPQPNQRIMITIGNIEPEVGVAPIAYGDRHEARFWVSLDAEDDASFSVLEGSLRFDEWTGRPGTTATGALRLVGDGSEVAGTFTARICPER